MMIFINVIGDSIIIRNGDNKIVHRAEVGADVTIGCGNRYLKPDVPKLFSIFLQSVETGIFFGTPFTFSASSPAMMTAK